MHRQAEGLAPYIPQRHVERAERVDLLASRRIEERARHVLPEALDEAGVLADQAAADGSSRSFEPPSPMPMMPPSVSTVTTMSLWLGSGFKTGGVQMRTRVIFIFGIGGADLRSRGHARGRRGR